MPARFLLSDMEKIDIYKHRYSKFDKPVDPIDYEFISDMLRSKNRVRKSFGLCSEPWDKYFELAHVNERGSSCAYGTINRINVRLAGHHATRKKKTYFNSMYIYLNNGFYYLECFVQTSWSRGKVVGPDTTVYKVEEKSLRSDLPIILDEIFQHVC